VHGRRKEVPDLVKQCIDSGESASEILENHLVPGMMIVGERFKQNEIFVPEMLIARPRHEGGVCAYWSQLLTRSPG
jgi:methanogenic corrinoid protein MtbC1